MVPLSTSLRSRRPVRRRDFAPTNHRAPVVARRLSQAYHHEPAPRGRKWFWLLLVLFVVGGIVAGMLSPFFTIRNVIINGVQFKPTEQRLAEILDQVRRERRWHILPQSQLLFFSQTYAQEVLAREFYIDDVSFTRHWPNVLKVNVASNVVVAVWQVAGENYLVDRRGVLVQQLSADSPQDLIVVAEQEGGVRQLGDQVVAAELAVFLDELYRAWRAELPLVPLQHVEFNATSLPTLQVLSPEGWYVNVTTETGALDQVVSLKRLLEERIKDDRPKLQYIDVRFGSRLYFKLK